MSTSGIKAAAVPDAADKAVTWQMWVPCLTMAACSWLAFFHRQILSVLAPTILAETGLNAQQFASISSYFFVAYFIGNPLWGSVLDYIGLRLGMLIGVSIWTVASVSHGWMSGFLGFAAARGLLGLGEGVTFPGGLRTALNRSLLRGAPAQLRCRSAGEHLAEPPLHILRFRLG